MNKILLAVDFNNWLYRAEHSHPTLSDNLGRFTGGLYGFLAMFGKAVRETKATHVVFCQDRRPYLRSLTYPDYKRLRKKPVNTPEENSLSRHLASERYVVDVLKECGLPLWGVDGFEADDLMAHCVIRHRGRFDMIYGASNDSDLNQLLEHRKFVIYNRGIKEIRTDCTDLFGHPLTSEQFVLWLALIGTHNEVEGIPGIGPVTAGSIIRDPALLRKVRIEHADVIDRNLALIKLPHPEFPRTEPIPGRTGPFSFRTLYRSAGAFDIQVTKTMLDAFEQVNRIDG